MRNVFDQYTQPENRVTHALASALSEDPKLLRAFVAWVGATPPFPRARLFIVEQQLPGDSASFDEGDPGRKGLPDVWIHDNNAWSLVIESKIAAPVSPDQIERHLRTAARRGFDNVSALVIHTASLRKRLSASVRTRLWTDVYQWLVARSRDHPWARRAAEYFEIAETRVPAEHYLKEGTLTVFSGVPFGPDNPYNYPEAKRALRLAMDDLRARRTLVQELGANPDSPGRGAITGTDADVVWDFLPLDISEEGDPFTATPHLTLVLNRDRILAGATFPNGMKRAYLRSLTDQGTEGFSRVVEEVNGRLLRALGRAEGAAPWMMLLQRHYPSQRSHPIHDATLEFDLRTAFRDPAGDGRVKVQPQWLGAVFDALSHKGSNLQLMVGAAFPYDRCSVCRKPEILDRVEATWIACKPLLERALT